MKKVINFLLKILLVLIPALALFYALSPYYQDGRIIAGGEGSYFLDFPVLWQNYGAAWINSGAGMFATSLNFAFLPHLIIFQKIAGDQRLVNFLVIFLIYFLPFLAVYLLCLQMKVKSWLAFLLALFYVSNPFMVNFLKSINQWNMLAAYILPAFFLIILKFYHHNLALFFFFGFHSLIFSFANSNPPTMALYQILIPLLVFLAVLHKEKKFILWLSVKKYFLLVSSFFLFNLWWILNWAAIFFEVKPSYSKQFAISWLRGSGKFVPEWWRIINLASFLPFPADPNYDFLTWFYSRFLTPFILLIPALLFIYFLFRERLNKSHHYFLALLLIVFAFLAKGVAGLGGQLYEWMVMKVPFFSIFKSAGEKWGVAFVFFLVLYFAFNLIQLKGK